MFGFSPFRGGVHPDGFKELSCDKKIKVLPLPEKLFVPLRQHSGSEALAIVKAGDYVLKGQLIAKPGNGLSAPVHAPSSGIVEAVEPTLAPHPSGIKSTSVAIKLDGKDKAITDIENASTTEVFKLDPDLLAEQISRAGIVGMGGAAFPAAVKLSSASNRNINTLLINGGECEPYLTADDRLMCERAEQIVLGARLIQYIIKAQRIAIAIEDNKPEAIQAMQSTTRLYGNIDVVVVPSRYPMGSAKQMILAVTGKEVPAGGRSSDVGVLMHNVATAYATALALTRNIPLISRIVTVSGGAIKSPQNVEALIGTPIKFLIEQCGGTLSTPSRILLGGPMMGNVMPSDEVPLIKGAAGVLALLEEETPQQKSSPCIRCGRCVEACPMGLIPLEMSKHARHGDFEGANEYGLKDCILCGSCAYVCPSHIPLVHYFQYAKGQIGQERTTQKRNELTKHLSEAKRLRLEKEEAEKAAKKAAKAKRRQRKTPAKTTQEDA